MTTSRTRKFTTSLACAVASLIGGLHASPAHAATFDAQVSVKEYAGSVEGTTPSPATKSFIQVNDLWIPFVWDTSKTWTDSAGNSGTTFDHPFDSTILKVGSNKFYFAIQNASGDDTGVIADHEVWLESPFAPSRRIFFVQRRGNAFSGTTSVDLTLREINPPLADDIDHLEAALNKEEDELVQDAATLGQIASQQSRFNQLKQDLVALSSKSFDEITAASLDSLLQNYADILTPEARSALTGYLDDLRKSSEELQLELSRLLTQAGQFADDAVHLVTSTAEAQGWNPSDLDAYAITSYSADIPDIAVPDLSSTTGVFDPNNDPYAAYADNILAKLRSTVSDGDVAKRAEFASIVRGWRENQAALEKSLRARGAITQKETAAYIAAQNRVSTFVFQYMDAQGWFKNTPMSPSLKSTVDGVLLTKFADLARTLKDHLNEWKGKQASRRQQNVDQTLQAIGAGLLDDTVDVDDIQKWDTRPVMRQALADASSAVKSIGGFGFSITPVGPFLTACEAFTGWRMCDDTDSDKLSPTERVVSGVATVFATSGFWKKAYSFVGTALEDISIGSRLAAVADKMKLITLSERLLLRSHLDPRSIASLEKVGSEAFVEYSHAAIDFDNYFFANSRSFSEATALDDAHRAINSKWVNAWVQDTKIVSGTSRSAHYVRVFSQAPGIPGGTYPTGSWLTLASEVDGLSAAVLKDRLALPYVPTHIVDVNLPPGIPINVGPAGPNPYGAGGLLQVEIATAIDWANDPIARSWFGTPQPLP